MNDDGHSIRKYLLGELAAADSERIESALFLGEISPEAFRLSELHLIDDYLEGGLSPEDRTGFEECFLSTRRRQEDLRFTMALCRYAKNRGGHQQVKVGGKTRGLMEGLRMKRPFTFQVFG